MGADEGGNLHAIRGAKGRALMGRMIAADDRLHRHLLTRLQLTTALIGLPPQVSREWNNFVESIDRGVEEALRQTAKRSLLELSRSINGDAKTEVQALFRISVVLQTSKVR